MATVRALTQLVRTQLEHLLCGQVHDPAGQPGIQRVCVAQHPPGRGVLSLQRLRLRGHVAIDRGRTPGRAGRRTGDAAAEPKLVRTHPDQQQRVQGLVLDHELEFSQDPHASAQTATGAVSGLVHTHSLR